MLPALREFVLVGDASEPDDDVPPIDDPKFSIAPRAKSRTVRRTWLDTFDWRLFRAGLTLELTAGSGFGELTLTGRDGELVAAEPTGPSKDANGSSAQSPHGHLRWPSLADALPLGPLREHLAPVVGIRALLPVARATSVVIERRALNTDEKTIALVTIDRMAVVKPSQATTTDEHAQAGPQTGRGQAPIAARMAIAPLRGYQAQAARLADSLATAAGVAPATRSAFESALSAAGRKPGDYSGKIDVRLTGTMPAARALAIVLGALFDTVQANLPGTVSDTDTEFLHDLRVAVRRTRAVLKSAGSALPANLVARYRPEFKWLGDLTTPTRDLDVYLLGYPAMTAQLVGATAEELAPFHEYMIRQRALTQRQLARSLRSPRFAQLANRWRQDLDRIASAPQRRPAIGRFAARRIARANQRVLRDGAAIDAASPGVALHELRKRCKELRYLLEIFASLHSQSEQWRAVNELKALQDCLGEFQDSEVQRAELLDFATRMMADRSAPAQTLLAMGEIAASLAVRQARARSQFADRFASFSSSRGQARIDALTAGAA